MIARAVPSLESEPRDCENQKGLPTRASRNSMKSVICTFAFGMLIAQHANAEVVESSVDHFLIGFSAQVEAPPVKVYLAMTDVARWWSDEQTWSGKAGNLSLKPEAGGCFCERWANGSGEHGRVILAIKNEMLRLDTALGPLQEFALNGILTFKLQPAESGTTRLDVDYRVNGSSTSGLDRLAPTVDDALADQVDRLLRTIDTGNPDEAVPTESEDPLSKRAARAELIEQWAKQAAAEKAEKKGSKPISPAKH